MLCYGAPMRAEGQGIRGVWPCYESNLDAAVSRRDNVLFLMPLLRHVLFEGCGAPEMGSRLSTLATHMGSGFEPHWRPQPAKLPSFGGYSLENLTLPYLLRHVLFEKEIQRTISCLYWYDLHWRHRRLLF